MLHDVRAHHHRLLLMMLAGLLLISTASVFAQDTGVIFPPLSGDYSVGRTMRVITDTARGELFTVDELDYRTLPLTIYYPAQPNTDAVNGVYAAPEQINAMAMAMDLPTFLFDGLHPNFYAEAAPLPQAGGYPVVLMMPGLGTPVLFYSSLLEQIASHGYVVVAVDPVYSSGVSYFPDGTTVVGDPEGVNVAEDEPRTRIFNMWRDDAIATLDALTEINADDEVLAGLFNLEQVGMFGHSFGGAVSAQVANDDRRVVAAINMDGSMWGSAAEEGVSDPFMLMLSEETSVIDTSAVSDAQLAAAGMTREDLERSTQEVVEMWRGVITQSANARVFVLTGSVHFSYATDSVLVRDLAPDIIPETMVGSIPGGRITQVISDYAVAFFDAYVKGRDVSPLLNAPSEDYPEVVGWSLME